jgi:hypothetical protein
MPNQVDDALLHVMSGYELSRVRTELDQLRIVPTIAPHPVQPNGKFSGHGYFGNSFFPAFSSHLVNSVRGNLGSKTEKLARLSLAN